MRRRGAPVPSMRPWSRPSRNASRPDMKVAMLGTRGVPAAYSGFETCVEAVGKRLVARGHDVSVYCRRHLTGEAGPTYLGMRRIVLPAIRTKGLETLTHTFFTSVYVL